MAGTVNTSSLELTQSVMLQTDRTEKKKKKKITIKIESAEANILTFCPFLQVKLQKTLNTTFPIMHLDTVFYQTLPSPFLWWPDGVITSSCEACWPTGHKMTRFTVII